AEWVPLWKTPNFPTYTSGHSTFSGTADAILTAFFGPNVSFTIGSDDLPGVSRSFASFTQAAAAAGESRVMGGIHFEVDNHAGLDSGRALGGMIANIFLRHPAQAPLNPTFSGSGLNSLLSGCDLLASLLSATPADQTDPGRSVNPTLGGGTLTLPGSH